MIRIKKVRDVEGFAAGMRPRPPARSIHPVSSILSDVRLNGDVAVRRYEKKFGGANISSLAVSKAEIKAAYSKVTTAQLSALRLAKKNLEAAERSVMSLLKPRSLNLGGVKVAKSFVPVRSVGCYIPGGLARYPSSAIMGIIPAKVAGVKRIVAVSPAGRDGKPSPITIVAADMAGATEIYKTGGVQAIAALSYGTKSIPKVDKIVGPAGALVTSAKWAVSNERAIDMLAGPTELGIVADSTANPEFVARDIISQAEHGPDTACYVITDSEGLARMVDDALERIIPGIGREKFVRESLARNGFAAICKKADMARLADELAPEHLQIMTKNPAALASKVTTPGLVLLGPYTPSSASDYMLGTNHILPTLGFGKSRGSLSVLDFVKLGTKVQASKKSLAAISGHLGVLADAEGLPNHADAVRSRLE